MTAPSLFDFDFSQPVAVVPLGVGDIVKVKGWQQSWRSFPHWQIVAPHPDSSPLNPFWMCRAVPVSTYGGQVAVLHSKDLERTGLSWRVPSYAEVEQWLDRNWSINSFHFGLDFQRDGTVFICKGGATWNRGNFEMIRPGGSAHWGAYVRFPPLPEEAELLELMSDLLKAVKV